MPWMLRIKPWMRLSNWDFVLITCSGNQIFPSGKEWFPESLAAPVMSPSASFPAFIPALSPIGNDFMDLHVQNDIIQIVPNGAPDLYVWQATPVKPIISKGRECFPRHSRCFLFGEIILFQSHTSPLLMRSSIYSGNRSFPFGKAKFPGNWLSNADNISLPKDSSWKIFFPSGNFKFPEIWRVIVTQFSFSLFITGIVHSQRGSRYSNIYCHCRGN